MLPGGGLYLPHRDLRREAFPGRHLARRSRSPSGARRPASIRRRLAPRIRSLRRPTSPLAATRGAPASHRRPACAVARRRSRSALRCVGRRGAGSRRARPCADTTPHRPPSTASTCRSKLRGMHAAKPRKYPGTRPFSKRDSREWAVWRRRHDGGRHLPAETGDPDHVELVRLFAKIARNLSLSSRGVRTSSASCRTLASNASQLSSQLKEGKAV